MSFLISFLIIAAAELGDKTQLLTLGFATRFPVWQVIGAVAAATSLLMVLAVIFGGAINRFVPEFYLQLAAGLLFIGFGLWTFFSKEDDDEEAKAKGRYNNPFLFIFSTFFLAELGDKTQLATLTLSAKYGAPFQVWLGATLGMVGVNVIAALSGSWIKKYVADRHIKWIGASIFIIFGIITLWKILLNF
ncbi:MAG: TMEM165/GDT1 family protein [Candidatus Margulisbacteria bacterium]|nr:TMEM165/GDT1 family protein [Candidatus Margulisiibacteriota bacterium]